MRAEMAAAGVRGDRDVLRATFQRASAVRVESGGEVCAEQLIIDR